MSSIQDAVLGIHCIYSYGGYNANINALRRSA